MITDYDYIVIRDPEVWWHLLWGFVGAMAVVLLITILYTIFAKKRTADGYAARLLGPTLVILVVAAFTGAGLGITESIIAENNIKEELEKTFTELDYEGDYQFTAVYKDTPIRGALVPANPEGEWRRLAVLYVAQKTEGE